MCSFLSSFVERREKDGLKPFCDNVWLSDTFRKYYLLGLVVLQYFLPLIILTGAYVRMATRLWGATAPGNAEDTRDAAILRNKKRVRVKLGSHSSAIAIFWLRSRFFRKSRLGTIYYFLTQNLKIAKPIHIDLRSRLPTL